jgi:uncharacterized protein (DUF362 family)/NAD-dependent dihydropyrimidine dehydrogenase PreA subunit
MVDVYSYKINNYDEDLIYNFFEKTLTNLNLDIKNTDKIAIKVNALAPFDPSKGITTHPIVVKSLIKYLKKFTNNIYVGDNPATKGMIHTLKVNKTYDVIEEMGVNLINPDESITIIDKNNTNTVATEFNVTKDFIECDYLFNLAKLKTHGLAYFTGCVKNLFGFIYGLNKASYHLKYNNIGLFSECICDLYNNIQSNCKAKKIIHVMDGILGLEGDGPGSKGVPTQANCLLLGLDPFAVDLVAINCAGLNPNRSFIHMASQKRNIGCFDLKEINIIGNQLKDFDAKFEEPDTIKSIPALRLLEKFSIKRFFFERPKFNDNCVKCKECIKICPAKALSLNKNNKVVVNKEKCIRCWCCQEVCPFKAIDKSKRPILGKIFFRG